VRLFPGARRQPVVGARSHRTLVAATALVVAAAALGPVAYADGHHRGHHRDHQQLKHKAHQVHGRIRQVTGDLDDVSSQVLRITRHLEAAQGRLVTARATLVRTQKRLAVARATETRLQGQLRSAQSRLDTAVAQVTAAQGRVAAQRETTRNTVIGYSTQGDPRLAGLSSYLHSGSLADLAMSSTASEVIVGKETRVLGDLQQAERALQTRKDQVENARNHVRWRRDVAQRNLVQVRSLVHQAVANKHAVKRLVWTTKKARRAAVAAKRRDMAHLRALKQQEARIQRRILAATAGDHNRHVGNTHGMFAPPVRHSYITSPYGWRIHPIYHYWGLHDGDDFHAPCGTPERAVGPGKVVAQYYSDVWGHRLYFDLGRVNGHHFVAIYNHISAYRSHVGERVGTGQTLALAGTTGWSTACHLHFTLMRDGRAVDPAPYLGF
jgi:murein DD-endopeptidase MepM/ murein hydrolase activator NlpD